MVISLQLVIGRYYEDPHRFHCPTEVEEGPGGLIWSLHLGCVVHFTPELPFLTDLTCFRFAFH